MTTATRATRNGKPKAAKVEVKSRRLVPPLDDERAGDDLEPRSTVPPTDEATTRPPVHQVKPSLPPVAGIVADLQSLQRQRAVVLKSKIMQENRLVAVVAGSMGYSSGMEPKDREAKFKEARAVVAAVAKGGEADHPYRTVIQTTLVGIDAFDALKEEYEKRMRTRAAELPVAPWFDHPDRRGMNLLFLAIVVGECGDLSTYANPAKVWRRMGCAPWTFDGQTKMGATWRGGREGKLPAAEWEAYGYNPRRRSIAYLIGTNIVMQNGKGPYRARYDEAKAKAHAAHPDWPDGRCDKHARLLATKLFLKQLWVVWTGADPNGGWKPENK